VLVVEHRWPFSDLPGLRQPPQLLNCSHLHSLRPLSVFVCTAECILRDEPLPDLHAGATSLSGLLRSGLGRLGVKVGGCMLSSVQDC